MRIAHLILTHGTAQQLDRLIERISYADDLIFIHVDLKTDIALYKHLFNKPNIHFIKNRIKVYWGTYSIVRATLNSLEEIIASNEAFDYLNLLSGQDYPLKPNKDIHEFLELNRGKAFMEFYDVYTEWQEAIPRIEKYYLTAYHFKGKYFVEKILNRFFSPKKTPYDFVPVGRSQWFTITRDQVNYIYDYSREHRKLIQFFKLTWGSDELFFQTILYNSVYKKDMVNNNLRLIDWSEKKSSPKTFTLKDADTLSQSDKSYARKFNIQVDSKILDYLDKHLI